MVISINLLSQDVWVRLTSEGERVYERYLKRKQIARHAPKNAEWYEFSLQLMMDIFGQKIFFMVSPEELLIRDSEIYLTKPKGYNE